ncbi:LacI family DNA-binding transcriptional regulator [Planosporangium sp. 12N6]|uniref:LacI family DNA-binding transcriptional regulator n=1 Tax=Planosporangium spinosum TaxID=3402278 RepID=UPI003CE88B06
MPVTIRDVAKASGVHISTVSRTFTAPHLVREETRARVLAVAERMGYRPDRAARSLITGRTQNLGLIVADLANPFFPPLIKAAARQAGTRDYHVFVADTDEDPAVEEELVRTLAKQVDGILLCSPRMTNDQIQRLSQLVPLVVINRRLEGLATVVMDVGHGARLAVEHLTCLGHRDLAMLGGPRRSWTNREIRRSATAAARAAGVKLTLLGPYRPTQESGERAAGQVAAAGATAVLAYNDLMAIGLLDGLTKLGLRVPEDISIVGVDDIGPSRCTSPKLTTVANPTVAAGRTAVDMLLNLDDPMATTAQVVLHTTLVVRQSTGRGPHVPAPGVSAHHPSPRTVAS